ncbi:acyl-CoA dehydrogenase family protein [Chondromyces crocatus]|uniref:Acyl-CoA dehydrogenase n=1 Tax=Chondromyces crocatus TaxID=52 RepID=A0A0K1EMG8_CHOCO|nr:acyl-CoA dehydrogenase family protein [Chondromyces crocatus]AKT41828.1 uncharacterized protein CMC5_060390 [Chondromyces crocatus]
MDFAFTADQQRVRDAARSFAERALAPIAQEVDRSARFPEEIVPALAEQGWLAPTAQRSEGGAELDTVGFAVLVEELSRVCATAGTLVRAHGALFSEMVLRFGEPALRREVLAEAAAGRALGASALGFVPEVPGAGVTATPLGDGGYQLQGATSVVLLGPVAAQAIVVAAEGGDPSRTTALVVKRDEGLSVEAGEARLGLRGVPVGVLRLEGARVPPGRVLGEVGEGDRVIASARALSCIGVAAQALGIARAACDEAVSFAKAPRQAVGGASAGAPGAPLSEQQGVQFLVADMVTELNAARMLLLRAAALRDGGKPCLPEAAAAKLYAAGMASRAAQRALQVLGAAGWAAGAGPDRHARDARLIEIDEGSDDEQRKIVAGGML